MSHCQAMIKMINANLVLQHFECYMNATKINVDLKVDWDGHTPKRVTVRQNTSNKVTMNRSPNHVLFCDSSAKSDENL